MKNHGHFKIIIVGAGPGGLSAAHELNKLGQQSVLVLEKSRQFGQKVCAGGLTAKDFRLGLPKKLAGREFTTPKAICYGHSIKLQLDSGMLATCDRGRLGQFLAERAVNSGTQIRTGQEVSRINFKKKTLTTLGQQTFSYEQLIGADGPISIIRRQLKIPSKWIGTTFQYKTPTIFPNLEIHYNHRLFGPMYGWIFPHRHYTMIGTGGKQNLFDLRLLRQNFKKWTDTLPFNKKKAEFQSCPINVDYRGVSFPGDVYLIGEAAGLTGGLTGEGIQPAMVSGLEVARKICNPGYEMDKLRQILAKKHTEEAILKLWQLNRPLGRAAYRVFPLFLRNTTFQRRLVRFLMT